MGQSVGQQSDAEPGKAGPAAAPHHDDVFDEVGAKLNEFGDAAKHLVADIDKRAGRNLPAATVVAIAILLAIGASLIWWPWGMVVLVCLAVIGGELELYRALRDQQAVHLVFWPLAIGSVILVVGVYGWHFWPGGITPAWWLVGVAGLTMVVVLAVRLAGPIQGYLQDVATSALVLVYLPIFASTLLFVLAEPRGSARLATLVLAVTGSDTGGYFAGLAMGRHPMSPKISPKKSWEGVVGAYALSMVVTALMTAFLLKAPWWYGVILSGVIVTCAILGDLVESIIKRDLGVKDMGSILAGHGGFLDRIDSYLLAAVPGWLAMTLLLPHA